MLACATCPVRDRAACAVLDDEQRGLLARSGRIRRLSPGEVLFAAGDDQESCATLTSGALKVSATEADGTERILALVHPAGFVGELFGPFAHYDVVALTDSELCLFSRPALERAMQDFPQLSGALLRRTQEDLHASRELLALTGAASADQRVGGMLMALARAASDSPCHPAARFDLPLSRGELAAILGLTIETVSRTLTRLEKAGAIRKTGKRGIEILDPALLPQR